MRCLRDPKRKDLDEVVPIGRKKIARHKRLVDSTILVTTQIGQFLGRNVAHDEKQVKEAIVLG